MTLQFISFCKAYKIYLKSHLPANVTFIKADHIKRKATLYPKKHMLFTFKDQCAAIFVPYAYINFI